MKAWSIDQVANHASGLKGFQAEHVEALRQAQIDGESLLLFIKANSFVASKVLPAGLAIKLETSIRLLDPNGINSFWFLLPHILPIALIITQFP